MEIFIPHRFRTLTAFSIVAIVAVIIFVNNNARDKKDYDKVTGKIIYLDKKMGEWPNRDFGKYRYLKLDNYSSPFEIYTDEQGKRFDSLRKGDIITSYFYVDTTFSDNNINRHLQYVEKGNKLYFERGDFRILLGYSIIGFLVFTIILWCVLYQKGKIPYQNNSVCFPPLGTNKL